MKLISLKIQMQISLEIRRKVLWLLLAAYGFETANKAIKNLTIWLFHIASSMICTYLLYPMSHGEYKWMCKLTSRVDLKDSIYVPKYINYAQYYRYRFFPPHKLFKFVKFVVHNISMGVCAPVLVYILSNSG